MYGIEEVGVRASDATAADVWMVGWLVLMRLDFVFPSIACGWKGSISNLAHTRYTNTVVPM